MPVRSTTDEMLAARFDPEPYESNGRRFSREVYLAMSPAERKVSTVYLPRVECIPSRDPMPWRVEVIDREDMDLRDARNSTRLTDPAWVTFWDASTERLVFDPRPEYARPEPNPILVAFRSRLRYQHSMGVTTTAWGLASIWLRDLYFYSGDKATPAQIEDARKVLTRLVSVYGGA
jgi:hypothetical protein